MQYIFRAFFGRFDHRSVRHAACFHLMRIGMAMMEMGIAMMGAGTVMTVVVTATVAAMGVLMLALIFLYGLTTIIMGLLIIRITRRRIRCLFLHPMPIMSRLFNSL